MKILWLGTSITFTAFSRAETPAPTKLEYLLGPGHVVANFGVLGATIATASALWSSAGTGRGYDVVVEELGVNDAIAGTSGATMLAAWETLMNTIRASSGSPQLVVGLCPPWAGYAGHTAGKQTEFDALLAGKAAYAATHSLAVVDWNTSMGGEGGDPDKMLATYANFTGGPDWLHPGQVGATKMATDLYDVLT